MAKITPSDAFKRISNRYRLVIMNDDTYEEVATLKLTRWSVYTFMSVIFVLLVGITIAVISFTNLKYLIPGYGTQGSLRELRQLKMRTDSLETALIHKDKYFKDIQIVLQGDVNALRKDTTTLVLPKVENEYQ